MHRSRKIILHVVAVNRCCIHSKDCVEVSTRVDGSRVPDNGSPLDIDISAALIVAKNILSAETDTLY